MYPVPSLHQSMRVQRKQAGSTSGKILDGAQRRTSFCQRLECRLLFSSIPLQFISNTAHRFFFFYYYYFFSESERFARSEVKSEWSPEQLGTEWSGALSEGAGMDSSEN